jgi:two-component system, NarL family, sensor kinase
MDANEAKLLGALLVVACVVGLILVFFIITISRYHRQKLRLYKEKIALEIETREKERARIASDLHDHLGPILSVVKLQASVLESRNEEDRDVIDELKANVDGIVESIRIISNDLRPNVLERLGIYKAIGQFVSSMNDVSSVHIVYKPSGNERGIPKDMELHVFRIVQEVVHNVIKHSKAKNASIVVERKIGKLSLQVSDNGCGFDFEQRLAEEAGSGLRNIVNRVELLKASLIAESRKGRGAFYRIDIPIKEDNERKD